MCSAGTLVGRASYPPQRKPPSTLESEAAIPGGPPAVDGGGSLRRDWLKATSMKCGPTPVGLLGSSALGQSAVSWLALSWVCHQLAAHSDPWGTRLALLGVWQLADCWQGQWEQPGSTWSRGTRAASCGGHVPRATREASHSEQESLKSLPCDIHYHVGQSKTQASPESRNQEGIHLLMELQKCGCRDGRNP